MICAGYQPSVKHYRHPESFPVCSIFSMKIVFNSVFIWFKEKFYVLDDAAKMIKRKVGTVPIYSCQVLLTLNSMAPGAKHVSELEFLLLSFFWGGGGSAPDHLPFPRMTWLWCSWSPLGNMCHEFLQLALSLSLTIEFLKLKDQTEKSTENLVVFQRRNEPDVGAAVGPCRSLQPAPTRGRTQTPSARA